MHPPCKPSAGASRVMNPGATEPHRPYSTSRDKPRRNGTRPERHGRAKGADYAITPCDDQQRHCLRCLGAASLNLWCCAGALTTESMKTPFLAAFGANGRAWPPFAALATPANPIRQTPKALLLLPQPSIGPNPTNPTNNPDSRPTRRQVNRVKPGTEARFKTVRPALPPNRIVKGCGHVVHKISA